MLFGCVIVLFVMDGLDYEYIELFDIEMVCLVCFVYCIVWFNLLLCFVGFELWVCGVWVILLYVDVMVFVYYFDSLIVLEYELVYVCCMCIFCYLILVLLIVLWN